MKVVRRKGKALELQAKTPYEAELLAYLWCNRTKVQAFERLPNRLTTLTIGPTPETDAERVQESQ